MYEPGRCRIKNRKEDEMKNMLIGGALVLVVWLIAERKYLVAKWEDMKLSIMAWLMGF